MSKKNNNKSVANKNAAPPPLAHAVAGSIGSAVALLLLFPLERARTQIAASVGGDATPQKAEDDDAKAGERSTTPSPTAVISVEKCAHDDDDSRKESENPSSSPSSSASSSSWVTPSNTFQAQSQKQEHHQQEKPTMGSISDQGKDNTKLPSTTITKTSKPHTKILLLDSLIQLYKQGTLYRGVGPVVTTLAISNFVFFYAHSFIQKFLLHASNNNKRHGLPLSISILSSMLGGILNVLLTNPFWVANLRIMQGKAHSDHLLGEIIHILYNGDNENDKQDDGNKQTNDTNRQHDATNNKIKWNTLRLPNDMRGLSSLWNGTMVSLLLVSNPIIQFVSYEQLKQLILRNRRNRHDANSIHPWHAFCLGALAKAIATLLTYPLQLSQVLMRLQQKEMKTSKELIQHKNNTLGCLIDIYKRGYQTDNNEQNVLKNHLNGIAALYSGIKAKLLQTVLTSAFTFLTYEQILKAVHRSILMSFSSSKTR